MHIRLGRLILRVNRRSPVLWLPDGYKSPQTVYAIQWDDERDGSSWQLGAFTSETEARACLRQLEAEGWDGLYVNLIPVHERLRDWTYDR